MLTKAKVLSPKKILAIAKDVIKQIKVQKYIANAGCYLYILSQYDGEGLLKPLDFEIKDLQDLMKKTSVPCRVCARGALIMSKANLYNNCPVIEDSEDAVAYKLSKKEFPLKIYGRAELAFEGRDPHQYSDVLSLSKLLSAQEVKACLAFYNRYTNDQDRMLGIMRNIVRNKGREFKPKGIK